MTAEEAINIAAVAYLPATYKRALMHLEQTPCTVEALAEYLGMQVGSTYKLLNKLRTYNVVCVDGYLYPSGVGGLTKVWTVGARDKRPRQKLTSAERAKRWRQKHATPTIGVWGL